MDETSHPLADRVAQAIAPPGPFAPAFFRGRRVLVTGHTGFKGAWLCEWLLSLGADVTGCGLPPEDRPNLFEVLALHERMDHRELDLTDPEEIHELVEEVRPEIVFHLAAPRPERACARRGQADQPTMAHALRGCEEIQNTASEDIAAAAPRPVRACARRGQADQPTMAHALRTLETNVLGTANLLAALSAVGYAADRPCAVVCVTSDKCYAGPARPDAAHREGDAMGGKDIHSASKGMVELLCESWRRSFFAVDGEAPAVRLATARAGNVIGGGDWAPDRIVPDAMRALVERRAIAVRRPEAVRPWQHVLEPLGGYLDLAQALWTHPEAFATAWNFGPGTEGERSVAALCNQIVGAWGGGGWQVVDPPARRGEATCLRLDIERARARLGWTPTWSFETAVRRTVAWYRTGIARRHDRAAMVDATRAQIDAFQAHRQRGKPLRRASDAVAAGAHEPRPGWTLAEHG